MNYEEKYKEALERAKSFQEKYGGDYVGYIFPELTESEDERIRKELVEAFEALDIDSSWNGIPVKSILAWLEEQKPAEWSEEDEKMKERLITRLNWITHNTRTDGTSPNITFFDEINWLKSLRPSWKPSEVQDAAHRK